MRPPGPLETNVKPRLHPLVLAFLVFALPWRAFAAERGEAGLPFLRNYSPKEYAAHPQIFSIAQDRRGVLYFGTDGLVLEYDGAYWKKIPLPKGGFVRSLVADAAGAIYAGGEGDFGVLEADPAGTRRFVSYLDRLPKEDRILTQFWQCSAAPEGIFFVFPERIVLVEPGGHCQAFHPKEKFGSFLQAAGGAVYTRERGGKLLRLGKSGFEPAPAGETIGTDPIRSILPAGDGSLWIVQENRILRQTDSGVTPLEGAVMEALKERRIYKAIRLSDGSIALSTTSGVVVTNAAGELIRTITQADGLPDENVNAIYEAPGGALWIGHDAGVSRVESRSPLSFFDERCGFKGAPLTVGRHQGTLFAGTVRGLFRILLSANGAPPRFEPVPGIAHDTWVLLSTENGLLAGTSKGIFAAGNDGAKKVVDTEWVSTLVAGRLDPNAVYAAGGSSFRILRFEKGEWTSNLPVNLPAFEIKGSAEDDTGRLWLGTRTAGTLHVDPRSNPPTVEAFGEKSGLPPGRAWPYRVGGRILFATDHGFFRFDEAAGRFSPDRSFEFTPEAGTKGLAGRAIWICAEASGGNLWVNADNDLFLLRQNPSGGFTADSRPLRRAGEQTAINDVLVDEGGVLWVSTGESLLRFDSAVPKKYDAPFQTLLRRVVDGDGEPLPFDAAENPKGPLLKIPNERGTFRFEYAAPFYEDEARNEFVPTLEGFDTKAPAVTRETRKDYTRLPEGTYTFRVAGRNLYGAAGREASFSFTVLPPWFRTWWAYSLDLLALVALAAVFVWWRIRKLAAQNRRLQELVDERTEELRLKNDDLAHLNAEKNEFLGIVAHDLKNPLGAIRGYAEMIEEDAERMDSPDLVGYATRVKEGANLMFELVTNLLDINRIEQGKMAIKRERCDLAESVFTAAERYEARAAAKGIRIVLDFPKREEPVSADPAALGQSIDNLVSNAVKYSPRDKQIWLRVRRELDRTRFEVADEGPGLSAEDQKKLFGKFARLSAQPTGGEHSTGLGLAIVKRMIESMDGRVWCESELGHGATFVVELDAWKNEP